MEATGVEPSGVAIDGAGVRHRRKLLGLRVQELAERCGISVGYVSHIERGERRSVSPPVFGRICDALGLAVENRQELTVRPTTVGDRS